MMILLTANVWLPALLSFATPAAPPVMRIQDPVLRPADEGLSPAETRKAQGWIRDLGSEDFETRDAARKQLFALGPKVRPLLDAATESGDPEVRWNARKLVRDLDRAAAAKKDERPRADEDADAGGSKLRKDGSSTTKEPRLDDVAPPGTNRSVQRSQSISVGPDGRVRATVQEEVDGKLETRTYEAESMDALRAEHPELFSGVDIRIGGGRFGWPERDLPRFDDKDLEKLFEDIPGFDRHPFVGGGFDELRRRLEDMEKRMRTLRGPERVWQDDRSRADAVPEVVPENERLGVMIQPVHAEVAKFLGLEGRPVYVVEEVLEGSLARTLGLRERDVLVAINGRAVTSPEVIREVLRATPAGGTVEVEALRVSGDRVKVVAERPAAPAPSDRAGERSGEGTLRRDR